MTLKPFNRAGGKARKRHFDERTDARLPSGWWLLPSVVCGALFWGVIIAFLW